MAKRWQIRIADEAQADLTRVKIFDRARVRKRIDDELAYAPFVRTKHKKPMEEVPEQFSYLGVPVWQLTIVPYRVLYCLDASGVLTVLVLTIFEKKSHRMTGESL